MQLRFITEGGMVAHYFNWLVGGGTIAVSAMQRNIKLIQSQ